MKARIVIASLTLLYQLFVNGSSSADIIPNNIPVRELIPQTYHYKLSDLPKPYATDSENNSPNVQKIPDGDLYLNVPAGFKVSTYYTDLKKPRWLALSPEGDVLVTETPENRIIRLHDKDQDGKVDETSYFAEKENGLNQPFGMAFDGEYFYLGNTDAVIRFPYTKGKGVITGTGTKLTDLPGGGYNQHWTRNVAISPDKKWLYASVGSASNADIEELPRASILRMRPDGSEKAVFASGLRNPLGLSFHPESHKLFATVNERDKLGDDLVPDYFTEVKEGAFYGWPYAYLSPENIDPRHMREGKSVKPELAAKTITPDVLFESHSAAMEIAFADKKMFPARYYNGAFVTMRGSWNRKMGTGYKIVFVPFKNGKPTGQYEDFLTGFLYRPEVPETWARPTGLLFLPDGSLLFTDEINGRIYRVTYNGK